MVSKHDKENARYAIKSIYGEEPQNLNGKHNNGKTNPLVPTHDELRDEWAETFPGYAYGMSAWRRYEGGIWHSVDELTIKQGVSRVVRDAKTRGVRPTAALVASVTELARIDAYVTSDRWDADPDILVCENGTLHIPSGELREHNPDHYATSRVPYTYDPTAAAPAWAHFLKTTIPDAADFLQEFAGYSLTTDTSHELALWLSGPRGSGKSTCLGGLQAMLGKRSGVLGLADIERNRFALANLPGKTLMVATEQPSSYIRSTDVLNAIISGEPIQVERKYKDAYEITPRAKLAWAMNETPRITEANNGLFRRVKVVEFPELPADARDPELKALISDEGAGIIVWALEGLRRLRARGHFEIPDSVASATKDFQEQNDIPAIFVDEVCVREPGAQIQSSKLYQEYKFWCDENTHKPMSSTRVAKEWERLGFKKDRNKKGVFYEGVRMRLPGE